MVKVGLLPGVGVAVVNICKREEQGERGGGLCRAAASPPPTLSARWPLPPVLADTGERLAAAHARPSVVAGIRVTRAVLGCNTDTGVTPHVSTATGGRRRRRASDPRCRRCRPSLAGSCTGRSLRGRSRCRRCCTWQRRTGSHLKAAASQRS